MNAAGPTFNIYVPSYMRADTAITHKCLEYCTYVVRESEEEAYRETLGTFAEVSVLGVEDGEICSFAKVHNWLIENAPEDVICVLDDDIKHFAYIGEGNKKITDTSLVMCELERVAQIMLDLELAYMASVPSCTPYTYASEFRFVGTPGPFRWYYRKLVKGRYGDLRFFCDVDFVLQELLFNRTAMRPCYFGAKYSIDTLKGGNSGFLSQKKQMEDYGKLKKKWGKYAGFVLTYNRTRIMVER